MIPNCKLIRVEESKTGSFGAWLINGEAFCVTLEPPDLDNREYISNIPPGRYLCVRYHSSKYDTFQITEVPGRSLIIIHSGNTVDDTHGCILLGQYWDKLKDKRAVLNSGKTFRKFMKRMKPHETFWLNIVEV